MANRPKTGKICKRLAKIALFDPFPEFFLVLFGVNTVLGVTLSKVSTVLTESYSL